MRISATLLGLALAAGMAMAQKPENAGQSPAAPNAAQSGSKPASESTSASQTSSPESVNALKLQTYKGTLVDAACSGSASSSSAAPSAASSTGRSAAERESSSNASPADTEKGQKDKSGNGQGEANRSADAGSNCALSANSTEFALQTKEGRTLKFDAVGNERAKENVTGRKDWKNATAAGKPIQATVRGTESGENVLVYSIH